MYIEELADKIARDLIDALSLAPKPLLDATIITQTNKAIDRYRREVLETCQTFNDLRKLEDGIHTLFVELLDDIDFSIPLN